jgi:hypothetical protein
MNRMPPQQRNTPVEQHSDDEDNNEQPANATMRRVVSNAEINVGGERTSSSDYKVRKSSLIG